MPLPSHSDTEAAACGLALLEQAAQNVRWATELLDRAGVPVASYEAQGGGMCRWTFAGRVDHLLKLIERHGIDLTDGVLAAQLPGDGHA